MIRKQLGNYHIKHTVVFQLFPIDFRYMISLTKIKPKYEGQLKIIKLKKRMTS